MNQELTPSMRVIKLVVWFSGCLAIGGSLLALCVIAQYKCKERYRFECPMRMELIYTQILSTRDSLRGVAVSNLNMTVSGFTDTPAARDIFLCPGSSTKPGALRNVDQWTDYIYVDWSTRYRGSGSVPSDYPMLYDRNTAHHSGSVFIMDCGGRIFWDQDCRWLRRFANEHPGYQLPLPIDMKCTPVQNSF